MTRTYSMVIYRAITDPQRFNRFVKFAGPVMEAAGARIIAGGFPVKTFEGTNDQRVVILEFESSEAAQNGDVILNKMIELGRPVFKQIV